MASVDAEYSVYVGNFCLSTTLADMEELTYELFLQAGPLEKVFIPYDKDNGRHKGYGFVEFQHIESVQYSIDLLHGIRLCGRPLNVNKVIPRLSSSTSSGGSNQTSLAGTCQSNPIPSALPATATTSVASPALTVSVTGGVSSSQSSDSPFLSSLPSHSTHPLPSHCTPSLMGSSHYLTFDTAHLASGPPVSNERRASIPSLFPSMTKSHDYSNSGSISSLFPQAQASPIPNLLQQAQTSPIPSLFSAEHDASYCEPTRFTRTIVHADRSAGNHLHRNQFPPLNNRCLPSPMSSTYLHSSHSHSLPDTLYSHCDSVQRAPYVASHHRLHQSRLLANDYPGWVKPQVKEKMFQYHLDMLESTLQRMKSAMSVSSQAIGNNHHFS